MSTRRSPSRRRRSGRPMRRSNRRRRRSCSRRSRRPGFRSWSRPAPARFRTPSNTARASASRRRPSLTAKASLAAAQRQVDALKAQRKSAEANLAQTIAQRRSGRAQPVLHRRRRRPARTGRQPHRGGRRIRDGRNGAFHVRSGRHLGHRQLQGDATRRDAARAARHHDDRRLPGADHPGPCRQRPAGLGHGLFVAAGRKRDGKLRQDRPARAGQDRHGQSAAGRHARARACRSCRPSGPIPRPRSTRDGSRARLPSWLGGKR